jgi:hypothetical protein
VEIREATNAIVEKAVPAFAKRFEDFFRRIYRGQDGSRYFTHTHTHTHTHAHTRTHAQTHTHNSAQQL